MKCRRCQGCMTVDHFLDLMESGGEWWATTLRCINCGYVIDPVLEKNRQKQQTETATVSGGAQQGQDRPSEEELPLDIAA